jgi:hypothetical protein
MKSQNTRTSIALAAAVLLAGASAASAANSQPPAANMVLTAGVRMSLLPRDTLNLTGTQQKAAWSDLYVKRLNQKAPAGFSASVGAVLPNSMQIARITDGAASDVPVLRPYNFAMVQKKLLIVNPTDRKIAEVIAR